MKSNIDFLRTATLFPDILFHRIQCSYASLIQKVTQENSSLVTLNPPAPCKVIRPLLLVIVCSALKRRDYVDETDV